MTTSLQLTKLDPTRVDHPNMFARFKHSSLLIRSQKDLYDRSLVTWKLIFFHCAPSCKKGMSKDHWPKGKDRYRWSPEHGCSFANNWKGCLNKVVGYVWYNIRGATASVIILAKCSDNYYVYDDGFWTDQGTLTEGESSVRLTSSFRKFVLR